MVVEQLVYVLYVCITLSPLIGQGTKD